MARKAAATVRRPEASKVPYTRVCIWQNIGRVNAQASGWSKRNDSGERDMHPPPGEKSSRLKPYANDPLLFIPPRVNACRKQQEEGQSCGASQATAGRGLNSWHRGMGKTSHCFNS